MPSGRRICRTKCWATTCCAPRVSTGRGQASLESRPALSRSDAGSWVPPAERGVVRLTVRTKFARTVRELSRIAKTVQDAAPLQPADSRRHADWSGRRGTALRVLLISGSGVRVPGGAPSSTSAFASSCERASSFPGRAGPAESGTRTAHWGHGRTDRFGLPPPSSVVLRFPIWN
jgi:hypothetical protein